MSSYDEILKGDDLRSIGKSNDVVRMIKSPPEFDKLITGLHHADRHVIMRTADAIEKISLTTPEWLQPNSPTMPVTYPPVRRLLK